MQQLAAFTASPSETRLGELLEWLSGDLQTLVVFNHPCWDEKGVGNELHRTVVCELLRRYRPYLNALELNGLRSWRENRDAIDLGREFEMPVISGGDRHGLEPNTVLNLTNARTFAEFAVFVRTRTNIRRAFTYNAPRALALRGTATQLGLAAQLIAEASKPN